ncbi:MAG: cupin domain-containing protein [Henriciella sp.]|nr:cupin domain-containing protein [Henriciella sp.]
MDRLDIDVAERLKSLRLQSGLSQRKLADRAGVANATISQIESGALNPTVGALRKILSGFPMSLGEFFADGVHQADRQIFFAARDLVELSDGGVSYRQVGRDLSNRAIQLLHERYAPGAGTGRHEFSHDGEECGIILRGELTIVVDGEKAVLGPGDAYSFESSKPHTFKNDGPVECEVISACTPPTF